MAELALTINLASQLEVELYGSENGKIQGIYKKPIDVVTKVNISSKIGGKIKEVLNPYREAIKEIQDQVNKEFEKEIAKYNDDKNKAIDAKDQSTLDLLTKKETNISTRMNNKLNELMKSINKELDKPTKTVIPEVTFKLKDFDIVSKDSEGNEITTNALQGETFYEVFCTNFLKLSDIS